MSEENKGVSNTPDQTVGDGSQETQTSTVSDSVNQTVQYHTHKKLLTQHKNAVTELSEMKDRLAQIEAEKLEAEGNKDKLIESLKKQVQDTSSKLKQTVGSIAEKNAMSAIVEEAVKIGCNSPGFVKKFLADEIETLTFTQDFEPDRDQVLQLVTKAKEEAPALFGTPAPKTANHNKLAAADTSEKKKNLKTMTKDELAEAFYNSSN
jgi:hypothetical protein